MGSEEFHSAEIFIADFGKRGLNRLFFAFHINLKGLSPLKGPKGLNISFLFILAIN